MGLSFLKMYLICFFSFEPGTFAVLAASFRGIVILERERVCVCVCVCVHVHMSICITVYDLLIVQEFISQRYTDCARTPKVY